MKNIINLSSAELAKRVVIVMHATVAKTKDILVRHSLR